MVNRPVIWYSSEELSLVRNLWYIRDLPVASNSIPLGFTPAGLMQRGSYFYLVSSDGRLYQKYCKNLLEGVTVDHYENETTGYQYDLRTQTLSYIYGYYRHLWDAPGLSMLRYNSRSFIRFDISDLPEGFQTVKVPTLVSRGSRIESDSPQWAQWVTTNVYLDIIERGWNYDEIFWSNQPEALSSLIHLIYPPVYLYFLSRDYRTWMSYNKEEVVLDVTEAVRDKLASGEKTLDIRCKTDEGGEYLQRSALVYLGPMYVEETTWAIDLPSNTPSDLGSGGKLSMRIKTGYPTSVNIGDIIQFEAHGKEPLEWITSDGGVGKVDSHGLFTAIGKGTCTVTVTDALGNVAVSGITVQ